MLNEIKKYTKFDSKDSPNDVMSFLMRFTEKPGRYVFRGYSKSEEIYPKILRKDCRKYTSREFDLLHEFEKYGTNYLKVYNAVDFLACVQHYGLPTRLVDFTYNPFVALAFALHSEKESQKDKYYSVLFYELDEYFFTNDIMSKVKNPGRQAESFVTFADQAEELIKYFEREYGFTKVDNESKLGDISQNVDVPIEEKKKLNRTFVFLDPFQSNQRLIVQQGLFMVPTVLDQSKYKNGIKRDMGLIKIHKNLRDELVRVLTVLGCDMYHLMPDLDSICHNVEKNIFKGDNASGVHVQGKAL